jgi:hypothetical protein
MLPAFLYFLKDGAFVKPPQEVNDTTLLPILMVDVDIERFWACIEVRRGLFVGLVNCCNRSSLTRAEGQQM